MTIGSCSGVADASSDEWVVVEKKIIKKEIIAEVFNRVEPGTTRDRRELSSQIQNACDYNGAVKAMHRSICSMDIRLCCDLLENKNITLIQKQKFIDSMPVLFINAAVINFAITKSIEENNFEIAQWCYKKAETHNKINSNTYNLYIQAADKAGNIEDAEEAFGQVLHKRLENSYIISSMINAAGRANKVARVDELYQHARACRLENVHTLNATIRAAGKVGNCALVRLAFCRAKNTRVANFVTYTLAIKAAGRIEDIDFADDIFAEADAVGRANNHTYNTFMNVAGKLGKLTLVKRIADYAESNNMIDEAFNDQHINALVNIALINEEMGTDESAETALKLYDQAFDILSRMNIVNQFKNTTRDALWLDLHGYTHGTGIMILHWLIKGISSENRPKKVMLITGKGHREDNYLLFTTTLKNHCRKSDHLRVQLSCTNRTEQGRGVMEVKYMH